MDNKDLAQKIYEIRKIEDIGSWWKDEWLMCA